MAHFIDNSAALFGVAKGYSKVPDSAKMIHAFHALNVQLVAAVDFEWVPTDANIADLPSRGDFALLRTLGGDEAFRPAVLPTLGAMVDPLMPLLA